MKKIIIAMAAISAAFTMASCNKEQLVELENNPTEGNCIITASTESNITKTSLRGDDTKGYEVVWSEGDTFVIGGNTFTLIDGAGTTSGKFQGTFPEGDGPFTAYYPATFNGTDWPTTQTYTEGNITGSPMTAEVVKGAESLSFMNAGGILRLTVKGTDKIRKITVKADGLDEIALSYDGGVTLDADGTVFHIALPEGEYDGTSITVYSVDFEYCTRKLKAGTTLNIESSKITTATFTASEFKPEGALTGKFSINEAGGQVYFSQGNLTATVDASGIPTAWKFAANQYDCLGGGGANKTIGTAAGDVDLFGWSTDATNYGISTLADDSYYSGDFVEWGKAIDSKGTWRTLACAEWDYLIKSRTNSTNLFKCGVTVFGNAGCLIIAPDSFSGTIADSYDASNWPEAESSGLVCIPAAGCRRASEVDFVGGVGFYWSSTPCEGKAYCVLQHSGGVRTGTDDRQAYHRYVGLSVRLVTDVK